MCIRDRYTFDQCLDSLNAAVYAHAGPVLRCVPGLAEQPYKVRAAFVSMAYNIGTQGFCTSSVARYANAGDWELSLIHICSDIVDRKVSAIKTLYDVEVQSSDLPQTFRTTIDDVVRERLEADHLLAQLDKALMLKAHAILARVELPEEWETMTRGRRNLAPPQERGTTVNVSQQASAQAAALAGIAALSPREA